MNKGKLTTYALSLGLLAILLLCFFLVKENNQYYLAVIMPIFALLVYWQIKGRSILSINKRQVLIVLSVFALLFVMLYYVTGIFFGFYRLASRNFLVNLGRAIPIAVVVICIEFIRSRLIVQHSKFIHVIAFICCVLAEVSLSYNFYQFNSFYKFMDFVGLYLFPTIVLNLLFTYLMARYGALPNIAYKLITTLLPIFITVAPYIEDALFSLIKLLFPVLIYLFVKLLYEKKKREKKRVSKRVSIVITGALVVFFSAVIMLVSGQFHYKALVIATESMTGELNKGDVVVYEKYTEQDVIEEGQIIVFDHFGAVTVHRVVEIEHFNGETRYYTKGDANDAMDAGYITSDSIYGFVHFKVPYIGYPTLMMREIFK